MPANQFAWFSHHGIVLKLCHLLFLHCVSVMNCYILYGVLHIWDIRLYTLQSNVDDADIQREITNMFVRTNILIRKFSKCSVRVKTVLFKSYCICLYDASLWKHYNIGGTLAKMRSC